ncbi:hypothetical protein [Pontiella sulfatireligans]|uniref:Uncharacterized protein n=1 Tax=Pontiella sulfatireligans TaxID=2750658 RepID=A0A6C2UKY0_9BACT|nr:hypothetical protein [Pontiella sulfatireligans]VGO20758.1 hypothetical protein SCARR_02825 [Pontiella sulfatireligans]
MRTLKYIKNARPRALFRGCMITMLMGLSCWSALAAAPTTDIPFVVTISGDKNVPTFQILNQSGESITKVEISIGDNNYNFDMGGSQIYGSWNPNLEEAVFGSSGRQNTATVTTKGFDNLETLTFKLDIDRDQYWIWDFLFIGHYSPANTAENFTKVMFNTSAANGNVQVFVKRDGSEYREQLVLQDRTASQGYSFESNSRPPVMKVRSETVDGMPIPNTAVRVIPSVAGGAVRTTYNIGVEQNIVVYEGDVVEVIAPQLVYMGDNDNYLTDSSSNTNTSLIDDATQRFEAIGISVNNVAQTGDPTFYSFEVTDEDARIFLKWRHDYALNVTSDFDETKSDLKDEGGAPWAGPVHSLATGNPEPSVKLHWIPKGDLMTATVDGQVVDYSHPGLAIRYVPIGRREIGTEGPGSVSTNPFMVGQSPPARQQVEQFVMNGPASIEYVWQIQYGVTVNIDDVSRVSIPLVREFVSAHTNQLGKYVHSATNRYFGEGTFWFDPAARVQVLCQANDGSSENKALGGWINGDGYYFTSSGEVFSPDGSLLNGDSDAADWLPDEGVDGTLYRGFEIDKDRIGAGGDGGLQRSARVLWTYGNQAIAATVPIGQYVFQQDTEAGGETYTGATFLQEPETIRLISVDGQNTSIAESDMTVWDPNAAKLYPLVPGLFRATWRPSADPDEVIDVIVTAYIPEETHYPHIAGAPPVNLDPSDTDSFIFKEIKYTENEAALDTDQHFIASKVGRSVLLFSEIQQQGRGQPKEYLRVRTVESFSWQDRLTVTTNAVIGQAIQDPELDLAELGAGYVLFDQARYNPFIYDESKLAGLGAPSVYDMASLNSTLHQKIVTQPENLPGSIIPVNLHPGAGAEERIVVGWYDDPSMNDNLLWPHAVRTYLPRWPVDESEGLGRIVIASQHGSESLGEDLQEQVTAEAITNMVLDAGGNWVEKITPHETTFNPSRLQQAVVYNQPDESQAGYNPNEEHALMAPSLRYAKVSPRPSAAYALRDNDLNRANLLRRDENGQPADYTSHPYVLVQYLDTADSTFKMKVYGITAEDPDIGNYSFADSTRWAVSSQPSIVALRNEPHVVMEASEPVIPFYPLGVVMGAVPSPETFGDNITSQLTYWEDHKGTSWAVSGGDNAWFTQSPYYPLLPDFWWPRSVSGIIVAEDDGSKSADEPQVGDNLSFLPANISALQSLNPGTAVVAATEAEVLPTEILYKSKWPDVSPILKAGETLTFSGGEHRTDEPTTLTIDENGETDLAETPGLPGVLAFAVAEVAYDSLNPTGASGLLKTEWTARVAQVLEKRTADLAFGDFPSAMAPASSRTRISQGKYVFNELPASLQKRFRFDPIGGRIELFGLVNDKDIAEDTLTASPPAVYVLEPNIMTETDRDVLKGLDESVAWRAAVEELYQTTRNPGALEDGNGQLLEDQYLVGLERMVIRDAVTQEPLLEPVEPGSEVMQYQRADHIPGQLRAFGPGLALLPNAGFLDPLADYPDESYVTVVENNDPSLGGSPITLHVIKVDRSKRYRGAIKTVLSDNVFDENIVLRHTGDFGANADDLYMEWWYRPDDGSLDVPPPDLMDPSTPNPWKLFPDTTGNRGRGQYEITLKGNPNAPEALLADTWWFARYRHKNDKVDGVDWAVGQPDGTEGVNFTWAGAGNSDPFNDFDLDGIMDFKAQLAMGWIKRVLDAVNPYEARISDFEGDSPSTVSSMIQEFGARFEGPVALNPAKNVIENVGLIELYETILKRGRDLSIDLSRPISTPAIANALQLAATRISDFYMLLANEAYTDALNPTIGFGSGSVEYGSLAPAVFTFQNQMSSLLEEELALLRGVDDNFARPVYNRLFWNFTKGEGEAAYALNYNITDINADGFIDEDDAMILFPQGQGDAWGHYLTALRNQYDLLNHDYFNWVSRSEFYNLMDIVIKVDFLDERKFAQTAAAKAKAGAEIVDLTYREKFVMDPTAQWQGYTDSNEDRAWGVQGWARRAAQGSYFDWVTANALLPADHPNKTLEGIQKVDRASNSDIAVISANLNKIQRTFDYANKGYNPLGLDKDVMPFDIDPVLGAGAETHFEQIYDRATAALDNAKATWDKANEANNMLRQVGNTEAEYRNSIFQEDLAYRNRLIEIFGRPYEGTIGSGQLYPAGYDGPDLALHMYVGVREINDQTVPGPSTDFASFDADGNLNGGALYTAFTTEGMGQRAMDLPTEWRNLYAPSFGMDGTSTPLKARDGFYTVTYTDLENPKVGLPDNLKELMPVTTAGYTFQAPDVWGNRLAVGELQTVLHEMIQQEANLAGALAAWDSLAGDLILNLQLIDSRISSGNTKIAAEETWAISKGVIENTIKGIKGFRAIAESVKDTIEYTVNAGQAGVPKNLPTGGLAVSPGDALSAVGAGLEVTASFAKGTWKSIDTGLEIAELVSEIAISAGDLAKELADAIIALNGEKKEWLAELEGLVGDEPLKRIAIFKEMEALRQLSDRYRTLLDEGGRLVDERAAFNKRVAAQTQLNRYQDMTFRVSRNHALQTYRNSFDLAARYAFLAAKAYDYETNFDPADPGSSQNVMGQIVQARSIGLVDGGPQFGGGGLADSLAWLKTNYEVVSSQIGINNPQLETGKLSLRTELFRILPKGSAQPVGEDSSFPSPGGNSDALWKQALANSTVSDLWDVPEFRQHCRAFAAEADGNGDHVEQPGLVMRFSTQIQSGKNVFGLPLSGADHYYSSSVFANKIHAAGIWFSDYQSDDVLNDLPETPRVYLLPVGLDVMSVPTSANPDVVRAWNVVDQRIPIPVPALGSDLDRSDWVPLYDSLSGQYAENRRFSEFRAYHDGGVLVDADELVSDTRLFGRSVWNTEWMLIIPGANLNSDPEVGLQRFIDQVSDIKLVFETYGISGN